MIKHRQRLVVIFLAFIATLTVLYVELRNHNVGLHMPFFVKPENRPENGLEHDMSLQFPASFPREISKRELIKNTPAFKESGYRYSRVLKSGKSASFLQKGSRLWAKSLLRAFGFGSGINLDLSRCTELLVHNDTVSVSPKRNLNPSLTNVVKRFIREIDRGHDDYLMELKTYLDPQIRLQVEHDVVDKHWFSLAGSSVFLKEYGYHLMVSRLEYSPDGSRNNPKFSFAYAQLYDSNWKEVNDVGLVVPTNINDGDRFFTVDDQHYTITHYPAMLPVPFYHDYAQPDMKYLGPEDPRLILVRNKDGHEEPALIYNSYHQKKASVDDDEDGVLVKEHMYFRSMWVSWGWQFQRGKFAVEDNHNPDFDNRIYNRVKELKIKNSKREKTQKNWTPFVSEHSRQEFGYDKHLLFVYRWAYLHILKCDITSEKGKCGFSYTAQDNMKVTSKVGPLRGGTPMVNLNTIIREHTQMPLKDLIPQGREIWVGFARAHFVECGCGKDFYRPNLVVIVKDPASNEDAKHRDMYRISHISSFTSLDVEAISWDPLRPLDLCVGTNAIIPNGISEWTAHNIKSTGKAWKVDDMLTLSLSVSDCTIDVVHVKGLLNTLMNLPDRLFNLPPSKEGQDSDSPADVATENALFPSNDNIACAMEESKDFCEYYGKEVEQRRVSEIFTEVHEDDARLKLEEENLEAYRSAVSQLTT